MFGFDMFQEGDKYNGVYKDTKNYYYAKGFDCEVWRKQYKIVFDEFEGQVQFYWVCEDVDKQIGNDIYDWMPHVNFLTYENLNNNIR